MTVIKPEDLETVKLALYIAEKAERQTAEDPRVRNRALHSSNARRFDELLNRLTVAPVNLARHRD